MFEELDNRFVECFDLEQLKKATELFDSIFKDILENWDHYYQVYLDEVGALEDV